MMSKSKVLLGLFLCVCMAVSAQTRITLKGKPQVKSVLPSESQKAKPAASKEDERRYESCVAQAYGALKHDSFSVAKDRFCQALNILPKQPGNAVIYFELGQMAEREMRFKSAASYYTSSLGVNPNYVKAIVRRGAMCIVNENMDGALNDYNKALTLEPNNQDALFFRAYVLTRLKRYEEARQDYMNILKQAPSDERTLLSLALLDQKSGHLQDALTRLNGLIERTVNSATFYAARADVEADLGQDETARFDWGQAIRLAPKNVNYLLGRAMFLMKRGMKEEAQNDLARAQMLGVSQTEINNIKDMAKDKKKDASSSSSSLQRSAGGE